MVGLAIFIENKLLTKMAKTCFGYKIFSLHPPGNTIGVFQKYAFIDVRLCIQLELFFFFKVNSSVQILIIFTTFSWWECWLHLFWLHFAPLLQLFKYCSALHYFQARRLLCPDYVAEIWESFGWRPPRSSCPISVLFDKISNINLLWPTSWNL